MHHHSRAILRHAKGAVTTRCVGQCVDTGDSRRGDAPINGQAHRSSQGCISATGGVSESVAKDLGKAARVEFEGEALARKDVACSGQQEPVVVSDDPNLDRFTSQGEAG